MVTVVNKGVAEISYRLVLSPTDSAVLCPHSFFRIEDYHSFPDGLVHAASLCPTQLLMFLVTLCMFLHQESLQSEFTLIAPKDHTHHRQVVMIISWSAWRALGRCMYSFSPLQHNHCRVVRLEGTYAYVFTKPCIHPLMAQIYVTQTQRHPRKLVNAESITGASDHP